MLAGELKLAFVPFPSFDSIPDPASVDTFPEK
jgi:hypothetical protein